MAVKKKTAKAATKAVQSPGVVDLKAIEDELNKQPDSQAAFIRNPGKFLGDRGLKVRAKDKTQLKDLTRELTSGPRLAPGSAVSEAGITISIRVRF